MTKELDGMERAVNGKGAAGIARIGHMARKVLAKNVTVREIVFVLAAIASVMPWSSPPMALFLGLVAAFTIGHPYRPVNHRLASWLLQASVVGLGFGIDFTSAMKVSSSGFFLTMASISGTLIFGLLAGMLLGNDRKTSYLISSGTAICGGSAIAAITPVIDAGEEHASVALGTVFIFNAVALFVFPEIGSLLHMTQMQFGMWSAIAIHDTSSVVGAAGKYGGEALRIATTTKLARTLWIVPLAVATAIGFRQKVSQVKVPWFIGLFIAAMLIHTGLPTATFLATRIVPAAKTGLTLALFLIGAGFSREVFRKVGWRALLQGLMAWLAVSLTTLIVVLRMT